MFMELIHKKTVVVLVLLTVTGYSFGYEFTLFNKTKTPLVARLKTKGVGDFYKYTFIQPNKQESVSFDGPLCLESLFWAQFDSEKKFKGTDSKLSKFKDKNLMEIVKTRGYSDSSFYANVFEPVAKEYTFHPLQIRMLGNPLDEQKVSSASVTELAKIARVAAIFIDVSICKDRRFIIIDTAEKDTNSSDETKAKTRYNLIAVTSVLE